MDEPDPVDMEGKPEGNALSAAAAAPADATAEEPVSPDLADANAVLPEGAIAKSF